MGQPYWAPRSSNRNIAPAWVSSAMKMETGVAINTTPNGQPITTVDGLNEFLASRPEAPVATPEHVEALAPTIGAVATTAEEMQRFAGIAAQGPETVIA